MTDLTHAILLKFLPPNSAEKYGVIAEAEASRFSRAGKAEGANAQ
jgi:hypothetical protein